MLKVLITGPESSGKTVLSKGLADYFNGALATEYARIYLQDKNGYEFSDLLKIAEGQRKLWDVVEKNNALVFYDTGMEVIKIWSEFKYDKVDDQVIKWNEQSQFDLILLCKPNLPWEEDPLRECEDTRDELFEIYKNELQTREVNFYIIDEQGEARLFQAIELVSKYI